MTIRHEPVALADGDVLLVRDEAAEPTGAESRSESGLLDATEVARVLGEAVAGGLTFEALKALGRRLYRGREVAPVGIDEIRDAVIEHLTTSGYAEVRVTETQHVAGSGWSVEGRADSRRFTALAEESGRLVHVRVR